jgi:phytoene dehydrogenase-like protein
MIIIGAGIGGLATGVYAQRHGFSTQIFEAHTVPGGVCTGWQRKGYTFEGCIHHLAGASNASSLYRMWQELGAFQNAPDADGEAGGERPMLFRDTLTTIEAPDGKKLTVWTDLERLEQHLKQLSPADAKVIEEYVGAARRMRAVEFLALPAAGTLDFAKILPHLPLLFKWMPVTLEQVAARFQDPFLRRVFPMLQYDFANIPAGVNLAFLAGCSMKQLGWPVGGALALAHSIERRYVELGGQIHFNARVAKVLVERGPNGKDRAVGVRLAGGSEQRADIIVSNADGRTTIFDMLEGKYVNQAIQDYYAAAPDFQVMNVHVCLGLARDLSREPHALVYLLEQPIQVAGQTLDRLDLELYASETGLAPEGKGVLKVLLNTNYSYWKALHEDPARYKAEKERVAETLIGALERRFPGLRAQVEVVDVATPLTTERFTGSYHGLQAWGAPKGGLTTQFTGISKTLPGLEHFHMVGQWAGATIGVSTAAIMGRKLVESLR